MGFLLGVIVMKLATLRKRREFLRVRGGGRWSTHAFVLETKARPEVDEAIGAATKPRENPVHSGDEACGNARFGFTVTKRLGNAVRRNRIRRRLRAVVTEVGPQRARAAFDYVVIAREAAYDIRFDELTQLMSTALERVHQKPHHSSRRSSGTDRQRQDRKTARVAPETAISPPKARKNTRLGE